MSQGWLSDMTQAEREAWQTLPLATRVRQRTFDLLLRGAIGAVVLALMLLGLAALGLALKHWEDALLVVFLLLFAALVVWGVLSHTLRTIAFTLVAILLALMAIAGKS